LAIGVGTYRLAAHRSSGLTSLFGARRTGGFGLQTGTKSFCRNKTFAACLAETAETSPAARLDVRALQASSPSELKARRRAILSWGFVAPRQCDSHGTL
jgi:hypothetical protein